MALRVKGFSVNDRLSAGQPDVHSSVPDLTYRVTPGELLDAGILGMETDLITVPGTLGSYTGNQPFGAGHEILELINVYSGGQTVLTVNGDISGLTLVGKLTVNGITVNDSMWASKVSFETGSVTINGRSFSLVTTLVLSGDAFNLPTGTTSSFAVTYTA